MRKVGFKPVTQLPFQRFHPSGAKCGKAKVGSVSTFRSSPAGGMSDAARIAKVRGMFERLTTLSSDEMFVLVETLGFEDLPGRSLAEIQSYAAKRAVATFEIAEAAMQTPEECFSWISTLHAQLGVLLQQTSWTEDDGVKIDHRVYVLERLVGALTAKCFHRSQQNQDFSFYAVNMSNLWVNHKTILEAYFTFVSRTGTTEKPSGSLAKELGWMEDQLIALCIRGFLVKAVDATDGDLLAAAALFSKLKTLPQDPRLVRGESLEPGQNLVVVTCPPYGASDDLQRFNLDMAFVVQSLTELTQRALQLSANPREIRQEQVLDLLMTVFLIHRVVQGWADFQKLRGHDLGLVEQFQMPARLLSAQEQVLAQIKLLGLHQDPEGIQVIAAMSHETLLLMTYNSDRRMACIWRPKEVLAIREKNALLQALTAHEFPAMEEAEAREFVALINAELLGDWPAFYESLRAAARENHVEGLAQTELEGMYGRIYPLILLERLRDLARSESLAIDSLNRNFFEFFFGDAGRSILKVSNLSPGEMFRGFFFIENWLLAACNSFQKAFLAEAVGRVLRDPEWFKRETPFQVPFTTMLLSAFSPIQVQGEAFWSAEFTQEIVGGTNAQQDLLGILRSLPRRTKKTACRQWVDFAVQAGVFEEAERADSLEKMQGLLQI